MANVLSPGSRSIMKIDRFLGLNENPDGDTGLKPGEAAVMRNWRITENAHLRIRPGSKSFFSFGSFPVRGLWQGYVSGSGVLLAACAGHIWLLDPYSASKTDLGSLSDAPTHFFGFSDKVYILNGSEYKCWSGSGYIADVSPYIPLVAISSPPSGGGTPFEPPNKLTGMKRQKFSPDGSSVTFRIAEDSIDSVIFVRHNAFDIPFSASLQNGTITLYDPPPAGINSLEIAWIKGSGSPADVLSMRFAETFNGLTDTRVFLYGNGSNRTLFSGINELGIADPSYFPDLNILDVDSANTPLTGLIKHFDKLLAFKTDGLWAIEYGPITLQDGSVLAAFYTIPINREIGNIAPGQVRLVDNWPRTLFARSIYSWAMGGASVRDERTARRLSARVGDTLASFNLANAITFDDLFRQEFYVFCENRALIYNYALDLFYLYDSLPVTAAVSFDASPFLGTADGRILRLSDDYRNDDGRDIDAYWESGSLSFSKEWRKKFSAKLWVAFKPESGARVEISALPSANSAPAVFNVAAALATFSNASFEHWAFGTSVKPKLGRIPVKLRKFTFAKLIFSSISASATATILGLNIEVAPGGAVVR